MIARGLVVFDDKDRAGLCAEIKAVEGAAQPRPIDRLGQVIEDTEGDAHFAAVGDGDENDRDMRGGGIGFERVDDRPSVHTRHHHIGGDGDGMFGLGQLESVAAVARGVHVEAFLGEETAHQIEHGGIVVDDHEGRTTGSPRRHCRYFFGGRGGSRFFLRGRGGQGDGEGRPLTRNTRHGDVAAEELAKFAADGEAETGAAEFARGGGIGLAEGLEESAHLLGCHTDAAVAHREAQPIGTVFRGARDDEAEFSFLGEFARVAQQVEKRLADLGEIAVHRAGAGGKFDLEVVVVLFDQWEHG